MEHREEGVVYVGGMFFSNLSQQLSLSTGADPSFKTESGVCAKRAVLPFT